VGGTGYRVFVSLNTFCELPAVGEQVRLCVHTHVREDALHLYGFTNEREKAVFGLLLAVSGIGPRLAINVLSGIPAPEMIDALVAGDVARLMAVPGVGRKLAERLSVELKDRAAVFQNGRSRTGAPSVAGARAEDTLREAISALVNLGYRRAEAEGAVRRAAAGGGKTLEEIIRIALQGVA